VCRAQGQDRTLRAARAETALCWGRTHRHRTCACVPAAAAGAVVVQNRGRLALRPAGDARLDLVLSPAPALVPRAPVLTRRLVQCGRYGPAPRLVQRQDLPRAAALSRLPRRPVPVARPRRPAARPGRVSGGNAAAGGRRQAAGGRRQAAGRTRSRAARCGGDLLGALPCAAGALPCARPSPARSGSSSPLSERGLKLPPSESLSKSGSELSIRRAALRCSISRPCAAGRAAIARAGRGQRQRQRAPDPGRCAGPHSAPLSAPSLFLPAGS